MTNLSFDALEYVNFLDASLRNASTTLSRDQNHEPESTLLLASDTLVKTENKDEDNSIDSSRYYKSATNQQMFTPVHIEESEWMAQTDSQFKDQTPLESQHDLFTGIYYPLSSTESTLTSTWEPPQRFSRMEDEQQYSSYEDQQQMFDLTFPDSQIADNLFSAEYPDIFDSSPLGTQQLISVSDTSNNFNPLLNNLPPQWTVDTVQNFGHLFNAGMIDGNNTLPSLHHQQTTFDQGMDFNMAKEPFQFQRDHSEAPSSQRDRSKDALLLYCKAKGMTYKQIKEKVGFTEAESTLRGRYRTLTKSKEERVRKPKWLERDIVNLCHAVSQYLATNPYLELPKETLQIDPQDEIVNKIPWKQIANDIASRGSYRYGNATVKKKFKEVLQSGIPWKSHSLK